MIFTKKELKSYISNYKSLENKIHELSKLIGDVSDSLIFLNYEKIIHDFLVKMYGDLGTDLLEEYIFDQIDMDFDTLYDILTSKNYDTNRIKYTDSK